MKSSSEMQIIVVDFGSQTAHLIVRRLRDLGMSAELVDPSRAVALSKKYRPAGIIFSGGPASVYEDHAPTIDKRIFSLGIPILGICYGWQLMAHLLGGKVTAGNKEYGPTDLRVKDFNDVFYGLPDQFRVFESHGDTVVAVPDGFEVLADTGSVKFAAVRGPHNMFGVQFHPEVRHTDYGIDILRQFTTRICSLALQPKSLDVDHLIQEIKEKVGSKHVIGAISGGTDSSVAGAIVARAIGKQFHPVYIDSGLMREGTLERVEKEYPRLFGVRVTVVKARNEFLEKLRGVSDPEQKRKVIGKLYIDLFERETKNIKDVNYLLQGTTYADFIHSQGSKRSAHIKSHHNVGGLPKKMKLRLLEPLRYYYTDQVREIGLKLKLPKGVVYQQPFPGPGHAVRIVGAITKNRLAQQIEADSIVVEEMKKTGWYSKVFQCWSVMTGTNTTAIKGDSRFYGEVVAVRAVSSSDRMTADWVRLPEDVLARISTRIVNEVPDISRVVYDITSKPPATMEWE